MSENRARSALSHPLVLRGAWLRIDAWYRSADLAPQPELAMWRLHPEAELRKLGADLRAGRWRPSVWPQLPYPKKGARLRHYTLPSVRDQVAFMAHMVLLGPLLDSCLENFAFGNRWYRPLVWNRRITPRRWGFRPYPLLAHQTYRPFASSHGLYKRVANWTVARMTSADIGEKDYGGPVPHPNDYSPTTLPPWVRKEWWHGAASKERRAAWATLDVELAYPSVRLDRLMQSGMAMLESVVVPLSTLIIGYPHPTREFLSDVPCRRALFRSLVEGIQQVEIDNASIPRDAWRPFHAAPKLPPENKGLPTGLAVSGMLLNVALHDTDQSVLEYLKKQRLEQPGAFVRFADDMVVLSRSPRGLMDLIEAVWRGLADDADATLAACRSESNLYLGIGKISPDPVRKLVRRYLCAQGWKRCERRDSGCEELERCSNLPNAVTLGEWWNEVVVTGKQCNSLRRAIDRSMVGPEEVGPFVTTLVTRLSDIAKDTLSERFGQGARSRLVQLHDLARLDIDDQQIRADTRRAFAVNRLVRAWLPGDRDEVAAALAEMRGSIAHVLRVTPWKYSVWRAVVRAAARRPPHEGASGFGMNDDLAAKWLSAQLRQIAHHTSETADRTSWMHTWPEGEGKVPHERDPSWRSLYLSFHRTAFWQALADVLRTLWQHEYRKERSRAGKGGRPPPGWWTVRAIPDGDHMGVIRFLGGLDRWAKTLYPGDLPDVNRWSWEGDQLVSATIAACSASDVVEAWRRSERPNRHLMVPKALSRPGRERTMQLLSDVGRVCPTRGRARFLNESALAHVRLAGRDEKLGRLLFPRGNRRPRILGSGSDSTHTLMMGVSLGCSESVGRGLATAVLEATRGAREIHRDSLALREYGAARRILLGLGGVP